MLSPILPTISLTIEDIPQFDIFAGGDNISNSNLDDYRPMFPAEGASLLVDELAQAGLEGASDSYLCKAQKMRKHTACETELELSLESNSSDLPKPQKRKQSLLDGIELRGCSKFETILLEEDDTIEANSTTFLGKRERLNDDQEMFHLDQLCKNKSTPCQGVDSCLVNASTSHNLDAKRTCGLGHRLGPLSNGADDCYLCRSVLANIKRFAEEKGGALVSTVLALEVSLRCENNHEWTACYKKATKSWCKDCKVKRKQLLKEMLQAEDERITAERKLKQERLFEDARKRVQQNEEAKNK